MHFLFPNISNVSNFNCFIYFFSVYSQFSYSQTILRNVKLLDENKAFKTACALKQN